MWEPIKRQTGHVNYFKGNDKSKWRSNIPTYGAVTYEDVYKNIDVKFYGNNKNIEHDVIVRPGGDFSEVKFAYRGIKGLKVTEEGDLKVSLNHGKIIEQKPVIYQEIKGVRVAVEGSYKILKGEDGAFTYGFNVASYDRTKDLVIDPVLVYSTYLGGSNWDLGLGIAVDNTGAVYISGLTLSADFPVVNPIQPTGFGAFVTKINPAGTALVYSTYIAGNFSAGPVEDIAVDSAGAAYITGNGGSGFPLVNPIQAVFGGGTGAGDAIVAKISPAGSALVYSTYLGGSGDDEGLGIAVDNTGAAYVTGRTMSTNFPVVSPIQAIFGGGNVVGDAFVTKINPAGSAFVYSTYLGGVDKDEGKGIAVDSAGAVYVTGETLSSDFPTFNPIQGACDQGGFSCDDAFITKINPAGSALVYSTYLGGSFDDDGHGIAVDSTGAAYITGQTISADFPTVAPMQVSNGGFWDVFVTKINPAGSAFVYSTYLGGVGLDVGEGIAVDSAGAVYVTGLANLTFPLMNPIQAIFAGGGFLGGDAFVSKINAAGSTLYTPPSLEALMMKMGLPLPLTAQGRLILQGRPYPWTFPS